MRAKKKRVLLFITILLILAAVVVAMGTVFHWPSERFRDDAVYCSTAAAVRCGNWLLATEHSVIICGALFLAVHFMHVLGNLRG